MGVLLPTIPHNQASVICTKQENHPSPAYYSESILKLWNGVSDLAIDLAIDAFLVKSGGSSETILFGSLSSTVCHS